MILPVIPGRMTRMRVPRRKTGLTGTVVPGKSNGQRKPSGCATTHIFPSKLNHAYKPRGQPGVQKGKEWNSISIAWRASAR